MPPPPAQPPPPGARSPLPVDSAIAELLAALRKHRTAVLVAPPGAGKTTRVPLWLLDSGLLETGSLWLLQPRRVAARAAARRLAEELGEDVGGRVGYVTRDDVRTSRQTRILVVTEGVLTRRLLEDPGLAGIAGVFVDEFHERSRHADLALAMLREVRETLRENLFVLVASATLEPEPIARFLAGGSTAAGGTGLAPILRVEGALHPVEVRWMPFPADRPIALQAAAGVREALSVSPSGDVLVFLPGAGEIRRCREALGSLTETAGPGRIRVVPLHGDLPGSLQDEALRPAAPGVRKVILSTNVAETSLTIEGVTAVVDSGWARVLRFDPRSGLDRLVLARISRASATQRAGRAGRLAPGLALRLYPREEERGMAAFEEPEILRADLAGPLLDVLLWAARPPAAFGWFDPPPAAHVERALDLLRRLGAVERDGFRPTPAGHRMSRLGLHPRLAALAVAGDEADLGPDAAVLAALLEERDILASSRVFADRTASALASGPSDLLARLDLFEEARHAHFERGRLESMGLDSGAVLRVARNAERIRRALRTTKTLAAGRGERAGAPGDEGLLELLLAAFPDRLARRRAPGRPEAVLAGGRPAVLDARSVVRDAPLFLALEVASGTRGEPDRITLASAVSIEWLSSLPGAGPRLQVVRAWDPVREAVTASRRLVLDGLVLEEQEIPAPLDEETAALLAAQVLSDPARFLMLGEEAEALRARAAFVARIVPDAALPSLGDDALRELVPELTAGRRRLSEVREAPLASLLRARLGPHGSRTLDQLAPETIPVPSGRSARLRYVDDGPPVLAVKLQELFGLAETPRVAGGRIAVLLHLLSPAGRAVQVTSDLRSFWEKTYAKVRKELRGRYPRHPWPEDPWNAPPQSGTRKRPDRR